MQPGPVPLPPLRPELRLVEGAPAVTGEPQWLVHDPVQSRFIQIDRAAYHLLALWPSCRTVEELVRRVGETHGGSSTDSEIKALLIFLERHKLTLAPAGQGWRQLAAEELRQHRSPFQRVLTSYLFFRVPLLRPQRILESTLPLAEAVSSRAMTVVYAVLGLLGLYLAARQWEAYLATFPDFATFEGAILFGAALVLVKAAHELGHAYTAVRFGCKVPTMGVAFMLGAPLLYTDVTDAWRLKDRRQRLMIDTAGVRVEAAIAAVAIFLWSFLPDGPLKALAFTLSAVGIVSSLLINLNPFMRFDGYYVVSELLGVENLQPRAFELGRWQLREWLFALGEPCPESFSPARTSLLVAYAYATWIYRLVLFVGIALVVYHLFFKALGILLFMIEIGVFVARPVAKELGAWYSMRRRILANRRSVLTGAAIAALLGLLVVPWSTRVAIPAVVEMAGLQSIYPPRAGRVETVHVAHGQEVEKGAPLVTLSSSDIDHELELARTGLAVARVRYARRGADLEDRQQSLVLERTIQSFAEKIGGLERERQELVVRAPISGRILELNEEVRPGRWIAQKELVAVVGEDSASRVRGYVSEADLARIEPGALGRFVPESVQRPALPVELATIAVGAAAEIQAPELASTHAGPIAVSETNERRLVPVSGQYLVTMNVDSPARSPELQARGTAIIVGRPESVLARVWRQTLKVLMREAGA